MTEAQGYSFLEAKQKIEAYCAYQERCDFEVRQKLHSWKINSTDTDALISHLISHNFLNEERFAEAFVSGKFRIKKWGKIKIRQELKMRRISDYSIQKALKQIDYSDYENTARQLAESKSKLLKAKNNWDKLSKLSRYLASKGYEQDLIREILTLND